MSAPLPLQHIEPFTKKLLTLTTSPIIFHCYHHRDPSERNDGMGKYVISNEKFWLRTMFSSCNRVKESKCVIPSFSQIDKLSPILLGTILKLFPIFLNKFVKLFNNWNINQDTSTRCWYLYIQSPRYFTHYPTIGKKGRTFSYKEIDGGLGIQKPHIRNF